jgi:predicted nuclease of restriction endonuclease-like RecB superfamily
MLTRAQVDPFVRVRGDAISVEYLADESGRIVSFLDRLLRLTRRLRGRRLEVVAEALRRQERRVRDTSRLAGIARTLIEWCDFAPMPGSERLEAARRQVFGARGALWPPVPGDGLEPYADPAAALGISAEELQRGLYDDRPGARRLMRIPEADGHSLLARYNLELGRGVLRDATRVVLRTSGGWRDVFRAVKVAGLMHELHRDGKRYRLELSGPAARFLVRPARYGVRFARVLPVLARTPAWRVDADLMRDGRPGHVRLTGRARAGGEDAPVGSEPRRERYDSAWERRFARDFRASTWATHDGWTMRRERTPLSAGGVVFLPDFTLRHADGREAAVELVGFWTPEYLQRKLDKVRAAGGVPLVLVVARALAVGEAREALIEVGGERLVWCGRHPRVGDVLRKVAQVAART